MPRFYLVIILFNLTFYIFSQDYTKEFLQYSQDEKEKGDYKKSIYYLQKVLINDSNKVDYLWQYAELLRLDKNYTLAEYYYKKVYDKEESRIYLRSLFYLAEMKKNNGKFEEALELYKKCKKKYAFDKKEYLYLKSCQEIESCLWIKKAIKDTIDVIFNKNFIFNSDDSEYAPRFFNNKLYFSSLKADSSNNSGEVFSKNYKSNIYYFDNTDSSKILSIFDKELLKEHIANATFSLDGKRVYFTSCKENLNEPSCKILMGYIVNNKILEIDTLDNIINEEDANTTTPYITFFDNHEVLFFSSNRNGGKGNMDIYYSYIQDEGRKYSKPIPVENINSLGNEVCPYYDMEDKKLYFSSDWHYGFGGYDLFYSPFENFSFQKPENMLLPINSAYNDLYLMKNEEKYYFSSNRKLNKNTNCCSDIYSFNYAKKVEVTSKVENKSNIFKSLDDLNKKLPVTLYFHNDIPNPKSFDTITNINYINSYNEYVKLLPQYKKEYSKGLPRDKISDAEEDIDNFFIERVNQGVKDLDIFCKLLVEELENGSSIRLTVKGFASPLAKSDYNVNLTKRRISSLVNYLKSYNEGVFLKYFDNNSNNAKLIIQEIPFGEYEAEKLVSDNPNDSKNSIYSRAAASERKIEIQSVSYLAQDTSLFLTAKNQLIDLGIISKRQIIKTVFNVKNIGHLPLEIYNIEKPCNCLDAELAFTTLKPNENGTINLIFDPKDYEGKVVKSIYVYTKNSKTPLRLVITAEIK